MAMKEHGKTFLIDWQKQQNKTQESSTHPRTVVKNSQDRGSELNNVTILAKCILPALYAYRSSTENRFNLEVRIYSFCNSEFVLIWF